MPPAPTGTPSGRVLDFGRYAGWSLGQLAPVDPNYLEWLARTPIGRSYYAEIRELLTIHAATTERISILRQPDGGWPLAWTPPAEVTPRGDAGTLPGRHV